MRYTTILAALLLAGCIPAPPQLVSASPAVRAAPSDDFVSLVNAARASEGRAPLRENARLSRASRDHAQDMVSGGYFSHTGQDGSSFSDRARAAGYSCAAAENIASGQRTEAEVMTAWMKSQGHRRNILLSDATEFGIGQVGTMWVMMLGRGC